MPALRKKRTRKTKYKKIVFKLSAKQKESIDRYCTQKQITPIKLIKSSLKDFICIGDDLKKDDNMISENQLALFDMDNTGEQLTMFNGEQK